VRYKPKVGIILRSPGKKVILIIWRRGRMPDAFPFGWGGRLGGPPVCIRGNPGQISEKIKRNTAEKQKAT